jgi:hypothetical protein
MHIKKAYAERRLIPSRPEEGVRRAAMAELISS